MKKTLELRRLNGEFYTPTPFVDLAHKYISETFGEDWKDRFVVWDCAWGSGNLTRDYKFKELYCSTLEQSDIDTANQMGYNMEATKFQFDFLNDSDSKLPQSLRNGIESGKEILFLINPPYGTASGNKTNKIKANIAVNKVQNEMQTQKMGDAQKQLYTQFFYKICKLTEVNNNIKVAIFSSPIFLTSKNYSKFYSFFSKKFNLKKGFLFEAAHFSDVKGWGISFTIFDNSDDVKVIDSNFDIVDYNSEFELSVIGTKNLPVYTSIVTANNWVRYSNVFIKIDNPQLSSSINVRSSGGGAWGRNALGFFYNAGNSVETNPTNQALYTAPHYGKAQGFPYNAENFHKVVSLFTARKSITANWINCKDEYLAPNENHPQYEQFTYDSIVYSLFNNSSQQSSLRQVEYKDKLWDIKNEFFWMSKVTILKLAEEHHYDALYKDARTTDDRFVYNKLFGSERIYDKLSEDAKELIIMANELIKKSFEMRMLISENRPEYHLDSWDAGYAQLKLVWKEYFKDEFKEFRNKYKSFEDRLRPLVYELGFLKK